MLCNEIDRPSLGRDSRPSATEPDWERERERPRRFCDPSRRLLRSIRRYQSWVQFNALLLVDVPVDCVAVGVPAKIIPSKRTFETSTDGDPTCRDQ